MECVQLHNGVTMPLAGLGTFGMRDAAECETAVRQALALGCRLFDTAPTYGTEAAVGRALQTAGVPRQEVFLTTKVWVTDYDYARTRESVQRSMQAMQTDYLDLVLLHVCLGDYYSAYRALEDLYTEGTVRAIGISNFSAERTADLVQFSRIKPMVNQVETHVFHRQQPMHRWLQSLGVQHEAWGPLARQRRGEVLRHPLLQEIGAAHGKTAAQVALRSLVQCGVAVIPKSASPQRIQENLDLFDFTLTEQELDAVRTLDEERTLWLAYDDPRIVQDILS